MNVLQLECCQLRSIATAHIMSEGEENGTRNQSQSHEGRKKKWYLDIPNTPCARNALINGILGGFIVGFLYFARTNIVRKSCDWAVGGFGVVSIGSWEICRMGKAKQRANVKRTVQLQVLNSLNNANNNSDTQPPIVDSPGSSNTAANDRNINA